LIHHAGDLFAIDGQKLWNAMVALKEEGLVKKIGISVYNAEQIDEALKRYAVDLVQVPVNIFDQRLLKSGHLKKLKDRHIEVHGRSIFLQGLLLMEPSELPPYLNHVAPVLQKYRDLIKPLNFKAMDAALAFVDHLEEIDAYIVGLNNSQQFEGLLCHQKKNRDNALDFDYSKFAITDENIINPFLWSKA
jgi:aryl-alcohol dehydrogenase-like predicted oxidoreductase